MHRSRRPTQESQARRGPACASPPQDESSARSARGAVGTRSWQTQFTHARTHTFTHIHTHPHTATHTHTSLVAPKGTSTEDPSGCMCMPPRLNFGTPLTRFVAPQGAPPKAPVAAFACLL
eukprot:3220401-Pyramimonas_sp.AAC.1